METISKAPGKAYQPSLSPPNLVQIPSYEFTPTILPPWSTVTYLSLPLDSSQSFSGFISKVLMFSSKSGKIQLTKKSEATSANSILLIFYLIIEKILENALLKNVKFSIKTET